MTPLELFAFVLLPLALPVLGWVAVRRYERSLDRQLARDAEPSGKPVPDSAPTLTGASPARP